jgi:hypothetical protein
MDRSFIPASLVEQKSMLVFWRHQIESDSLFEEFNVVRQRQTFSAIKIEIEDAAFLDTVTHLSEGARKAPTMMEHSPTQDQIELLWRNVTKQFFKRCDVKVLRDRNLL